MKALRGVQGLSGIGESGGKEECQTLKIRPSHNECLQNSSLNHIHRLVSRKTLRELNAHRALPAYPVFEDEKSKESGKKSVKLH